MALATSSWGWLGLAGVLFVSSFGAIGGFWMLWYFFSFITGFIVMLFLYGKKKSDQWLRESEHLTMSPPSIGIRKLVEGAVQLQNRPSFKIDKRMTGSCDIDDVLQEVLEYTYRDYIHTWYRKLSDDEQFRFEMRSTLQRVVIAFSERAKQVNLVPYLTTRLVDDFASHIRLYRRALNKVKKQQQDNTKPPADLEGTFFDLETEMEKNMCRDHICLDEDCEKQYLEDLSEVLLFLLLPEEDFHNKPFRYIVREVLVNGIFLPAINLVSEPDYINQTISWLCKESTFNNETFLTMLKTTDSVDELIAIQEKVDLDIARQRSRDSGGHDDTVIKQQLNSLLFVKATCESRIQYLQGGQEEPELLLPGVGDTQKLFIPGQKLYSLPLDVVLNNNVALTYFIEFMTNIGAQGYLFFYLTIEGFKSTSRNLLARYVASCVATQPLRRGSMQGYRVSAEQQISAAQLSGSGDDSPDLDSIKEAAISIFNQYLSDRASPQLPLDEIVVKNLWEKLNTLPPSDTIFDEVQARVWDILLDDPHHFYAFKQSLLYIKLLAELDLLSERTHQQDGDAANQLDSDGLSGSSSISPNAFSDDTLSTDSPASSDSPEILRPNLRKPTTYSLSASITQTGICREHGKTYAVYLISVTRKNPDGVEEVWDVYRRYSDFHDLHMTLQEKYDSLSGIALPSKKTFNNMNKEFLEKRRLALNGYLQTLLDKGMLNRHGGLLEIVHSFLEHLHWEREKSDLARKMDTLKTSVKSVSSIVKSMPDNFADGVAKVSGGIRSIPNNMLDGVGKILNVKGPSTIVPSLLADLLSIDQPSANVAAHLKAQETESGKVGASLDIEDEDNIPLRIMLLMLDEVFDLQTNQWLRRRIMSILRQIVKAMFGDSINRRIVEHMQWMTSADQIAEYIKRFRDSFWPNGVLADPSPKADYNTMMRMRVVCKAKLYGCITDELHALIGSDNAKYDVVRVFNLFQLQRLNKRMVYVILEGLLETIFPDNKFPELFRKLHSKSPRTKQENKESSPTEGMTNHKRR